MNFERTFALTRLYHQFLKPKRVDASALSDLVTRLYEARFIDLYTREENSGTVVERYIELPKLTEREHRDELFKLVQIVSDGASA